jgi:hypothetical protein
LCLILYLFNVLIILVVCIARHSFADGEDVPGLANAHHFDRFLLQCLLFNECLSGLTVNIGIAVFIFFAQSQLSQLIRTDDIRCLGLVLDGEGERLPDFDR